MESNTKKSVTEFSDADLLSFAANPKGLQRKNLIEIFDELKKRGLREQADELENRIVKAKPIYSTFWTRFAAYFIDVFVLGIGGTILGLLLHNVFSHMGNQGLLVGFLLSLLYFGLGNSKIFNGQTLGKKALQLQVVNSNLNTIFVSKSILRALIYTVPFFFLNYRIAGWSEVSISFLVKGILFLTFLFVLPFHLIINTPTRQGLHDLLLGTYVINIEGYSNHQLIKSKQTPLLISSLFAVLIIAFIVFLNIRNKESRLIVQELKPLKEQIDRLDKVGYSSISSNTSSTRMLGSNDISRSKFLRLSIVLKENIISELRPDNLQNLAIVKDAVKLIMAEYSEINSLDYIQVSLVYGYNIGISRSSSSITTSYSIEEWREKIK